MMRDVFKLALIAGVVVLAIGCNSPDEVIRSNSVDPLRSTAVPATVDPDEVADIIREVPDGWIRVQVRDGYVAREYEGSVRTQRTSSN